MAPVTILKIAPEGVEFRVARDGAKTAWIRLQNTTDGQVAYKVKSTAPKNYAIKPGSGSIRAREHHDVQISVKSAEEGGAADPQAALKKDRFLLQATSVETQSQKLLLFAADKGKAAGRTKFWESIAKEDLQEQQLPVSEKEGIAEPPPGAEAEPKAARAPSKSTESKAPDENAEAAPASGPGTGRGSGADALVAKMLADAGRRPGRKGSGREGVGSEEPTAAKPRREPRGYNYTPGMPTNQDIDSLLGKITKVGADGKPVVQVQTTAAAAEGYAGPPGFEDATPAAAPPADAEEAAAAAPAERKPLQLISAKSSQKRDDVVLQGHSRPVTYIAFDRSGSEIYTCGKDKLVIAWKVPEGECLRKFEGHRGAVWSCSLNEDEGLLLTCGADNMVFLWQAKDAVKLAEVEMPGVVRCVEWSNGLCLRFACCSNSFKAKPAAASVYELSMTAGAPSSRCCTSVEEPRLPSAASQVAWAGPYREWLCTAHDSGIVVFWNSLTGSELARVKVHEDTLSKVAFSALDGRLMATCGRNDMEVRLWCLVPPKEGEDSGSDLGLDDELEGGAPEPTLMRNFTCDRPLNCVAIKQTLGFTEAADEAAAGGSCVMLAGGGQDARDVALVGAGTDDQFEPIPIRFAPVVVDGEETPGLELCPAVGGWDPKSRKGGGHFGPIHVLAFSPDGKIAASGSEDGNVRLRDF